MGKITPHEFYQATNGKVINVDNAYGGQCWDLFAKFCQLVYGKTYGCVRTGYVGDFWNYFNECGLGDHFEKRTGAMQDGDWAIWTRPTANVTDSSHIAMFRADNGDGTGVFLTQDPMGTGNNPTRQRNISYNNITGFIRADIYKVAVVTPVVSNITLKYGVGQKMVFSGVLYAKASGAGAGQAKSNLVCTITKTYNKPGTTKPYNINNGLGWVAEADLRPYTEVVTPVTYTVVKGDTLGKIAKKYGTSVANLINLNKVKYPKIATSNGNYIVIGWTLTIK